METKNREKLLLIATGVLAVLWLLNLLVISPLIDNWHNRSDEIARLRKQIAEGTTLIRRESAISQRWDAMRANALASNPTVAERQLFTAFDHWVRAGGVIEGSFRPQYQEADTNYSTIDCRSDVSGNPVTVRDFLKAMSQDPLANKVDSFDLTARDDNGQQLTLGLSLSGLVLADSDPAPAPSAPVTAAPAQNSQLVLNPASDLFQIISRNNIFDQSRTPGSGFGPRAPKVESFTFCGAAFAHGQGSAFFVGSGVHESHDYVVGDAINGFKIAKIINPATVTMTNASSNTFVLSTGGRASLRRVDNGPWGLSGYIAADPAPESNATETASITPAAAGGKNNILEMLKKRREQEEK